MSDYPTPSLLVLIGAPGAGKSTWLAENEPAATRVSLEAIRTNPKANRSDIINEAIDKTFALLRDGKTVAFDSTAIDPDFRKRLRGIGETTGVPVYAVIFDTPLEQLLAAQQTRKHPVPDERVRDLYKRFQDQLPTIPTEGWAGTQTIRRGFTPEGGDAARSSAARMNKTSLVRSATSRRDLAAAPTTDIEPGAAPDDETMEAKPLCDWLAQLLGDAFTEYVQAHSYHWNCSGPLFAQYHDLFSNIAGDIYGSIDAIAENILKLGYDAPVGLGQLIAFRELEDPELTPDTPAAMAAALLASNVIVLDTLNDAFAQATAENEQGIANFLADRIDMHQKWSWQLRKSIDAQPQTMMEPTGDETIVDTDEEPTMERAFSPVRIQYRSSGAGKQYKVISGYAARTNSMSEDLGGFREIIAPGAFKRVLSENPDVRLLYSHNSEAVLARTGVNLELEEDELGLRMWARVDMNDPDVQRVASKLESGLVDAASFGFTVRDDSWEERGGYPVRTIREIDSLLECSVVAWPAYPATRLGIMDEAIRSGRLHLGGAARTAPITVGAQSREHLSGVGTSAAAWQARLSLKKHTTQR